MKLYIASDHAGIDLKNHLMNSFPEIDWQDLGPYEAHSVDYPDYADKVCEKVIETTGMGVLICGSGQGMSMRANKYSDIRAALCWNTESAKLSREHNNANVLCLGARLLSQSQAFQILDTFLKISFAEGRHTPRVEKLGKKISYGCP